MNEESDEGSELGLAEIAQRLAALADEARLLCDEPVDAVHVADVIE